MSRKKNKKIILYLIIILVFLLILCIFKIKGTKVLAATSSETSNVQLLARAINRRSKRRKLRGTSSCWSGYIK